MPNNKIIDLERLSRFKDKLDLELEKKANVDGNYPTLTVGLADNLTPYSEDSGAEQDNPFISNGTGTNNNTEIVTVGDYGLLKEKQGNSVVVNQLVKVNRQTTTSNGITFTNNGDGTVTVSGVATADANFSVSYSNDYPEIVTGHKYYLKGCPNGGSVSTFSLVQTYVSIAYDSNGVIGMATQTGKYALYILVKSGTDLSTPITFKPKLVDITSWDADIITDLTANPSHFSWYYNGSLAFNIGSLENANGVKLVSTGRQLWDGTAVVSNHYLSNKGTLISDTDCNISDYIRVVPSKTYILTHIQYYNPSLCWYDKDKNFISGTGYQSAASKQFIAPPNAAYCRFSIIKANANVMVLSLYYTTEQGGEGYDKYYPYEQPYVVDTGSDVLRKAGNVYDELKPDGTLIRRIGVIDLGTLNWENQIAYGRHEFFTIADLTNLKSNTSNIICSAYKSIEINSINDGICIANQRIIVKDSSKASMTNAEFKNAMSGVYFFYELATPTTEQGTPFAENLPINDYGMLYWLDENDELVGIPQGAKIFFPTNYKGFVDDMYSRVDGDSSKFVIQSELSAVDDKHDNLYAIMQENIGGALRHQLATKRNIAFNKTKWVDLGSLTWTRDASDSRPYFYTTDLSDALGGFTANGNTEICTKYQSDSTGTVVEGTCRFGLTTKTFIIVDNTYTSANDFKNAMKGVLVAYEKE